MMQVDRIALSKRKPVLITVGGSKISQEHLDGNQSILDYREGVPCPRCKLPMDAGETGACKYCTGDF